MAVPSGVVQGPFLVLVGEGGVGAALDQQPHEVQIALGCCVEDAGLSVGVFAVQFAAGVDQQFRDSRLFVVLCAVEERSLHIVVILVKVEAES